MCRANDKLEDHRGTILKVSQTVCYNYSGEVAMGRILDINPGTLDQYGYRKGCKIHIKMIHPPIVHKRNTSQEHSVVKNPKNLFVVFEEN